MCIRSIPSGCKQLYTASRMVDVSAACAEMFSINGGWFKLLWATGGAMAGTLAQLSRLIGESLRREGE